MFLTGFQRIDGLLVAPNLKVNFGYKYCEIILGKTFIPIRIANTGANSPSNEIPPKCNIANLTKLLEIPYKYDIINNGKPVFKSRIKLVHSNLFTTLTGRIQNKIENEKNVVITLYKTYPM